jgi:hypothetical protein
MEIPLGAKVCPFCRNDPRSQFEIDVTNSLAEGAARELSKPGGFRQFMSLFLGMWFGFMAWLFTKDNSTTYGIIAAVVGFALPYIPLLFNSNKQQFEEEEDEDEDLESLSFLELNNSKKFLSLSAKDQFIFRFKHHPLTSTIALLLFFGLIFAFVLYKIEYKF